MSRYELAQLNIGISRGPIDSPVMADFVANLERINALADRSPGFVWRLQSEEGDATSLRGPFGADTLVNMSVWKDVTSLRNFVYRTVHAEIMARRREWFERMGESHMVLWWVREGHRPSLDEAGQRLELLRRFGATEEAFLFRRAFSAPDAREAAGKAREPFDIGGECPAL